MPMDNTIALRKQYSGNRGFAVFAMQCSADHGIVLESPLLHQAVLSMSILIAGLLPGSVYGHLKNKLTKKECSLPIENSDDIELKGTQRTFVPLQEFVRRHAMTAVFFSNVDRMGHSTVREIA